MHSPFQPYESPPPQRPRPQGKPWNGWPVSIAAVVVNLMLYWTAPVAVVALAFSYLVDSRWKRGDEVGSRKASKSVFVSSALSIAFSAIMYFYL